MTGMLSELQGRDARLIYKLVVSSLGLLSCGLLWWRARAGGGRRWVGALLALLAVLGIGSYFELGALRFERYMNPHDVYHYYIGSKYSPELQYLGLYRASLVADVELNADRLDPPVFRERAIRDLSDGGYEDVTKVLLDADDIRRPFGVARWEEFKKDIRFFQDAVTPYSKDKWSEMLRDKGYNASPVWNAEARAIAARAPTSSALAMRLLPMIDLALLLGMFALVWRAFGTAPALLTLSFFGVDYMMSTVHIKGCFLRLDWLVLTVAAGALLRMRRPVLAGAALAGAALSRIFPLIFAFGPGVLLAENLLLTLRARRQGRAAPALRRDLLAFFLALALVGAGLFGASLLAQDGPALWRIFVEKITLHNGEMSSNRAGFKYLYYGLATGLRFDAPHLFDGAQPLYTGLTLLALVPTALALRRLQSSDALLLGFIPYYFLVAPTFYYDAILVAPLLFCAARMESGWRAAGAATLFGVSVLGYVLSFWLDQSYPLFFDLSLAMFVAVVVLGVAAWRGGAEAREAEPWTFGVRWEPLGALGAVLVLGALMLSAPRASADAQTPLTIQEAAAPGPGEASLAFVGDIMGSRRVLDTIRSGGGNWDGLLDGARSWLSEADLAIGNLETPVSKGGKVIKKRFTFRSPPELLPALVRGGFDVLSMANNHVLDYGPEAMEDTVRALAENGLRTGGVTKVDEAQVPLVTEVRGLRIGFLFYCDPATPFACAKEYQVYDPRPAEATPQNVERDVKALRPQVDVLVVVIHWDIEYADGPSKRTRKLARSLVDLGADVVAGSHPHVQFPIEHYKSGVILYSLGNFIFDQQTRPATQVTRIVRMVVGKGTVRAVQILPMKIPLDDWGPRPLTPGYVDAAEDSETLRAWPTAPPVASGVGPG